MKTASIVILAAIVSSVATIYVTSVFPKEVDSRVSSSPLAATKPVTPIRPDDLSENHRRINSSVQPTPPSSEISTTVKTADAGKSQTAPLNSAALPSVERDSGAEAAMREEVDLFEQNIQMEKEAFEAESVDFDWALSAENDLELGLESATENLGVTIVSSTCKTTRCKAVVAFDNYELAEQYGSHLAETLIPNLNCAHSIWLPRPDDTSASYHAELMLNCPSGFN